MMKTINLNSGVLIHTASNCGHFHVQHVWSLTTPISGWKPSWCYTIFFILCFLNSLTISDKYVGALQ